VARRSSSPENPTASSQVVSDWHTLEADEVLDALQVSLEVGLDEGEVAARQLRYGPNELHKEQPDPVLAGRISLLLRQLFRPLSLYLIGTALAAAWLGWLPEAGILGGIVVVNAALGFLQGFRAERALASLIKTADPAARVRRSHRTQVIPSGALVPGDILLLEEGDTVPADTRLLVTANLRLQEAVLTGETQSVEKIPQAIPIAAPPRRGHPVRQPTVAEQPLTERPLTGRPLIERRNMAYMGSQITSGRGQAVVVATGMETELGKISRRMHDPAQGNNPLGWIVSWERYPVWLSLALVAALLAAGASLGVPYRRAVEAGLTLAVGAAPLILPSLVVTALAVGAHRMRRRNALVRKLPAVEVLGSVSVICSDRTGILTENHMAITVADVTGQQTPLTATLHHGKAFFQPSSSPLESDSPALHLILAGSALCNNTALERVSPDSDAYHAIGDPSEGTQVVAAARYGLWKPRLERLFPRLLEVPYSSDRRRMSTVHRARLTPHISPDERSLAALFERSYPYLVLVKGNLNRLLEITSHVWEAGEIQPLTVERRAAIRSTNIHFARQGQRVISVAYRPLASLEPLGDEARSRLEGLPPELRESIPQSPQDVPRSEALAGLLERDLVLLGLIGLLDPPRAEVLPALSLCRRAGIRPVMFTADHPSTALEIARSLHITNGAPPRALTGKDLARLSPLQLESSVDEVTVFARITPEHKLEIVQALQRRGHVVATTGEGVTDAPALRRSDIGVAKGISGTSVSKEAANLVILDDNFATIVGAVEEGRRAFETVRTLVRFFLAGNLARVLVIASAALAGFLAGAPLAFTLVQVLWFGLVVEGILGAGLIGSIHEGSAMHGPPVNRQEPFFTRGGLGRQILQAGLSLAAAAGTAAVLGTAILPPTPGRFAADVLQADVLQAAVLHAAVLHATVLHAASLAFATLMFGQVWHALQIYLERSSWAALLRSENWVFGVAVLLGLAAALAAAGAAVPAFPASPGQDLLGTTLLSSQELLLCLAASLLPSAIWALVKTLSGRFPLPQG
jgi:Ca2+-transporting ATPase